MAPLNRDEGDSMAPADPSESRASQSSVPPPRASGEKRRHDPMIGRTIAGRFRIGEMIARGGMGKVYRAEQLPLGRPCAVKILDPKFDEAEDDPEFRRRFFLEASTASKLTHANTVTIYDYGEDDGVFYIAMEYVAGRTLFRVLRDDGPLEEHRVAKIVAEVARSLREAHGIGVIHRDMKPANIVLTESELEGDMVKLLDFGLVKHVEPEESLNLTQQGLFMGSPKYMAPEQILGRPISSATDVYALGVVAYELLTGRVPFDRGSSVNTLMAHVNDSVPPLSETNPDVAVSPEMTAIVLRCLEKDVKHRYASTDELLRDLSRVTGGGPMVESLLRVKKVSLPAEAPGVGVVDGDLDEDTAPRESDWPEALAALIAAPRPTPPPSAPPAPTGHDQPAAPPVSSGEPQVVQGPSAWPEPMAPRFVAEREPPALRRRWLALAVVIVAAAAIGGLAFALADEPPTSGSAGSSGDETRGRDRSPASEAPSPKTPSAREGSPP